MKILKLKMKIARINKKSKNKLNLVKIKKVKINWYISKTKKIYKKQPQPLLLQLFGILQLFSIISPTIIYFIII